MPLPHRDRPPLLGAERRAKMPRHKPLRPRRRARKSAMQISPCTPSLERRDLLLEDRGCERFKHRTRTRQVEPRIPTPHLSERRRQRPRIKPRPVVPTAKQLRRSSYRPLCAVAKGHKPRAEASGPDDERGDTIRRSCDAPPVTRGRVTPHGWVVHAARQHPKCQPNIHRFARLIDDLNAPSAPGRLRLAYLTASSHSPFQRTPITAPHRGWYAPCAKRRSGHAGSLEETTDIRFLSATYQRQIR